MLTLNCRIFSSEGIAETLETLLVQMVHQFIDQKLPTVPQADQSTFLNFTQNLKKNDETMLKNIAILMDALILCERPDLVFD
jgi:hypothetical protein